ncbi:MAG: RluA family pseudouridine synthase [Terriglobales bacterium]|jgi:23S rRNA pseudouridine1911/1915/1917 synthase
MHLKFNVPSSDAGRRLDHLLVERLPELSRARVQELIGQGKVQVEGAIAKPSRKLRPGEQIVLEGVAARPPLRAMAEDIPLEVVYEDDDLAVVNKPAGMMVHAGAGPATGVHNRGTLVNALLHRFGALSATGGALRPGIVHRLDRNTSGLIVVAKNDWSHRKLAEQFASRTIHKTYIALVHGAVKGDSGTVSSPISRDSVRRTRMTTRRAGGRAALSHWQVRERIDGPFGKFTLLEVSIETGRTHQIRVHLASLGYPVAGDTLYGAPREIKMNLGFRIGDLEIETSRKRGTRKSQIPNQKSQIAPLHLSRNFLHAAAIQFQHPRTDASLSLSAALPDELKGFLVKTRPAAAE